MFNTNNLYCTPSGSNYGLEKGSLPAYPKWIPVEIHVSVYTHPKVT